MTPSTKPSAFSFGYWVFDGLILFAAFLYFTAGAPLLSAFQETIEQKPSLHRAAVSALFVLIYLAVFLRLRMLRNEPQGSTATPFRLFMKAAQKISVKIWLWVLFFSFGILMTYSSWIRHESLHSGFDMAIFTQAVWNGLSEKFLYSSIKGGICILGDHFSPILGFTAILYRLWPDPKCLLLIQALSAAACVFPLYRITILKTQDKRLALAFALSFCLYLPVRNAVRFEFHPEVLAMPWLLWAFYFLATGRSLRASLMLFLSILSKENAALVTFAFGFYALFIHRKAVFGLLWMAFSAAYFFAAIHVFVPFFSGQEYFYLRGNFWAWKKLGAEAFLRHLLSRENAVYLVKIFMPVGFLSFLAPAEILLGLPHLLQNLTARNEAVRSIFFQYTVFLTPFVFIAAIYGAARLAPKKWLIPYLVFVSFLMSGVSECYIARQYAASVTPHTGKIKQVLGQIPASSSLRTHEFFAAHAAHRPELHIYENDHPREGGSQKALESEYVVIDKGFLTQPYEKHEQELLNRGYRQTFHENGLSVYRRR